MQLVGRRIGPGADKGIAAGRQVEIDCCRTAQILSWGAGHDCPLLTAQDPTGQTVHQVQVRNAQGGAFFTVATLSGATQAEQWLRWFPTKPLKGIRWVRIVTTASPSWVAWREVQVY